MDKIELINGYCNPKCIYFVKGKMPSFTEGKEVEIPLCGFGGNKRSFGCMNGCLNGEPQLESIEN